MTPEQAGVLLETLETFDRRLSAIDARDTVIETHLAEGARAAEEVGKSLTKLTDLYLGMSDDIAGIKALLANYVDATRARERQARQTEEAARGLVSEVRKRLPEVTGG